MPDPAKVIDELLSELDGVFERPMLALPKGVKVTTDRKSAKWIAGVGPKPKDQPRPSMHYSEQWMDTIELAMGSLGAEIYGLEECDFREALDVETRRLEPFFMPKLRRIGMSKLTSTVVAYAEITVNERMLAKQPTPLTRMLYDVLRASAVPCGCKGTWPDAPLLVYWPHKTPPKKA